MEQLPHQLFPYYIKYPPHSLAIDVELATSLGMEPRVICLMHKPPYIEGYRDKDEFILGGSFADFRDTGVLERNRDPGFKDPGLSKSWEEEGGPYARPWVLVVNECGNHGSILHFDTRNGTYYSLPYSISSSSPASFQSTFKIVTCTAD
jgi:hypothetical protein